MHKPGTHQAETRIEPIKKLSSTFRSLGSFGSATYHKQCFQYQNMWRKFKTAQGKRWRHVQVEHLTGKEQRCQNRNPSQMSSAKEVVKMWEETVSPVQSKSWEFFNLQSRRRLLRKRTTWIPPKAVHSGRKENSGQNNRCSNSRFL